MYKIILLEKAIKVLSKLPQKEADKIAARIDSLQENPYPHGCKKLQGYEEVYRIRQGSYRILYEVHDHQLIVRVIKIGNRKDIYRK
jgi:mRNA interferase RelE/StbE